MKIVLLAAESGENNFLYFVFGLLTVMLVVAVYTKYERRQKTKRLKVVYDDLLKASSKKAALDAGRLYYGSMRKGGKLTIYDEQALANDISVMQA